MGSEILIPAALAAAGTGVSYWADDRANKQRGNIAAQNIRTQGQHQRDVNARVSEQLGALEQSSPDAERAKALAEYTAQLRAARLASRGTPEAAGASARYKGDVETSTAAIKNYGDNAADYLSRIMGAGRQRQIEGIGVGRMASDVGGIARRAQGDDAVARLRMHAVQADPWLKGLGTALQAAAMAYGVAAPAAAGSTAAAGGSTAGSIAASPAAHGIGPGFGASARYIPVGF